MEAKVLMILAQCHYIEVFKNYTKNYPMIQELKKEINYRLLSIIKANPIQAKGSTHNNTILCSGDFILLNLAFNTFLVFPLYFIQFLK